MHPGPGSIESNLLQEAAEKYRETLQGTHPASAVPSAPPLPPGCLFADTAPCIKIMATLAELREGQARLEGQVEPIAADVVQIKVQLAEARGFFRGSKMTVAAAWTAVIGVVGLWIKSRL